MIEVKTTKTARNAIIGLGVVAGVFAVIRTAARDGYQPWMLAMGVAVIAIATVGAFAFSARSRITVINGELAHRPLLGLERRIPVSSIDRVLHAPTISQRFAVDQARFVVIGVDRKVFMRINPAQWDPASFGALMEVLRPKGVLVTATAIADIRKQAPEVLTEGELHPWRIVGRTILISVGAIIAIFLIVLAAGAMN
jgi:hypothetical protein